MMSNLKKIYDEIRTCKKCPLSKTRTNTVAGAGIENAVIMFIGEAPGEQEDLQGRPFVGAAGKFLGQLLESIGLKREEVYITNIVKCRPPGNRNPHPREIEKCSSYLKRQIAFIHPKIICLLGNFAVREFFDDISITSFHGVPKKIRDIWYFPMYHPAAALYKGTLKKVMADDMKKLKTLLSKVILDED